MHSLSTKVQDLYWYPLKQVDQGAHVQVVSHSSSLWLLPPPAAG